MPHWYEVKNPGAYIAPIPGIKPVLGASPGKTFKIKDDIQPSIEGIITRTYRIFANTVKSVPRELLIRVQEVQHTSQEASCVDRRGVKCVPPVLSLRIRSQGSYPGSRR
jgi:hypothetical protein